MKRIRLAGIAAGALVTTASGLAAPQSATPVQQPLVFTSSDATPYAFSDGLGGFAIAHVSGVGTRADPIRIRQDFLTASPSTMVIQAVRPINPFGRPGEYATGTLHIVIEARNESGVPWIGLELELQEDYEKPSIYGDGLSFDQRRQVHGIVRSSAFVSARTDYEPFDRLLFEEGALDPKASAEFRFLITDLTPMPVFYIRFDPRVPAS